jgi:prolipoprotein diacylglyceryltransferase
LRYNRVKIPLDWYSGDNELTVLLCSVFLARYHPGDEVKKTEIGSTCSTYGEGRGIYRVLVENLREGVHLKDQSVDVKTVLK